MTSSLKSPNSTLTDFGSKNKEDNQNSKFNITCEVQDLELACLNTKVKSDSETSESKTKNNSDAFDFEGFFNLQTVSPVSSKIDPFCPNGTSFRSCHNGFDDDFLNLHPESLNGMSNITQEKNLNSSDSGAEDDDDDDAASSSSSHASTIKSGEKIILALREKKFLFL